MSTLEQIKALREKTGAGIVDVKKALEEAGGDEAKTIELLRKRGQAKADKKADRETHEGVVGMYVHSNNKIGAMVKVLCETDFVARNEDFLAAAKDIAMHVTASNPQCVNPEDVTEELVSAEKKIWEEQLKSEGKDAGMIEKIMPGKEKKLREESALLTQPFVKDPEQTVGDVLTELSAKVGEKVVIDDFARFEL